MRGILGRSCNFNVFLNLSKLSKVILYLGTEGVYHITLTINSQIIEITPYDDICIYNVMFVQPTNCLLSGLKITFAPEVLGKGHICP